jgi:DNA-binding phage protein
MCDCWLASSSIQKPRASLGAFAWGGDGGGHVCGIDHASVLLPTSKKYVDAAKVFDRKDRRDFREVREEERAENQGAAKNGGLMVLTREFKLTIRACVQCDSALRKGFLRESVESFLAGDVDAGKAILRGYINAIVGFEKLAKITHRSPKSLMRMLGPSGNPHVTNLLEILSALQEKAQVQFKLKTFGAAAGLR